MDQLHSNSIKFSYMTFKQIDAVQDLQPLVYKYFLDENQKFTKFDYLKNCPDIACDFPCFFYLTDRDNIIARLSALPDKLYIYGKIFPWAWIGGFFTDPAYRGKGLGTLLRQNAVKILHKRNMAVGAVFSTPTTIHICKKLNFTIPGYANRYLLLKTIEPLLRDRLKLNLLKSALNIPYRIALRIILMSINRPLPLKKFDITVSSVNIDSDDLFNKKIPQLYYHKSCHFNDSLEKMKWKISVNTDMVLYFIKNKSTNEYLCYFVLKNRNRKTKDPFADRFFDVKLMTLMDYGVYNNDIKNYEALMSTVFSLFWNSDAEALEVISSSKILNSVLKRNGMLKVGGMSFGFSAPPNWKFDPDCAEISNWHLTHFDGDGFSFR